MAWTGGSGVAFVHPRLTNRGRACISRILRTAGWKEEQFWICRSEDVPQGARALVAMGDEAQSKLTGWSGGKRATKYTRGYELPSWTGRPVVPTFDPEQVVQGQWKLLSLMMHDIGVAMETAMGRGGVVHDPKSMVDYKEGVGALRELVAAAKATPSALIAFDLETRGSEEEDEDVTIAFSRDDENSGEPEEGTEGGDFGRSFQNDAGNGTNSGGSFTRGSLDVTRASITTVQFSIAPGTGVSAEWSPTVRELSCELMRLGNQVAGHNSWLFDRPILLNHDVPVPILTDDTMWMFHHMQPDLPAHLQGVASIVRFPFPWKHMAGSDLQFYGAADVDAVQWIMRGLPRDMKRLGLWDCYLRYVRAFRPILEDMEKRGIPVSREKLAELREWLQVEIGKMDERLQVAVPSEVCLPEKKEPYKGIPNDAKAAIKLAHPAIVGLAKAKQGAALKALTLDDPIVRQCIEAKGYGIREGAVWKEDKQPFNPRSPLQILSYLRHQNYAVPKRFRDGADSTADKELERLEVKTGDEVIKLTRGIRAYSKMGNAYAGKVGKDGQVEGGWYPGPDGRLRATFSFGPATGQLAAKNPNVLTTPKRRPELARKFRECIVAPPGHKIIEIDMRAFHARTTGLAAESADYMRLADMDIHSFLAGHLVHYPGVETCLSMSDTDLRAYLAQIKKEHKAVRDFKAKPCIAEGELVLTDRGLVPIERVTTRHRVWDGIEWVTHDGVVDQGIKEVMYYDGLWATPEHKVVTDEGRTVPMRQAASEMARLSRAGLGGPEVWLDRDYIFQAGQDTRSDICLRQVSRDWDSKVDISFKSGQGEIDFIHSQRGQTPSSRGSSWEALRRYSCEMQQSAAQALSFLWGEGYRMPLRFSDAIYSMGYRESPTFQLQGVGDRSNQQRWALRAREFTAGNSQRAVSQSPNYGLCSVSGGQSSINGISQSLRVQLDPSTRSTRLDRGGDNCKIRVYDILNAGPRHRFTVEGRLVLNCILGVGFKMGHRRLFFENRDSMTDEREAKHLLDTLKGLFPAVFAWQDAICEEADRKHHLINAFGGCRWFWDVFKWQRVDGEWRRSSSRDAEKVVAYLPSSNAHYMLRGKMLEMQAQGWLDRYGLVSIIHDAVLFVCPDALVEECIHNVKQCLEAPVPELAHPTLCPDGFTCGAEASVGADWATMEDCK